MSDKTLTPKPYKPANSLQKYSDCDTGEKELACLSLTSEFRKEKIITETDTNIINGNVMKALTRRALTETTNQEHLTPSSKAPQKKRAPIAPSPCADSKSDVKDDKNECALHFTNEDSGNDQDEEDEEEEEAVYDNGVRVVVVTPVKIVYYESPDEDEGALYEKDGEFVVSDEDEDDDSYCESEEESSSSDSDDSTPRTAGERQKVKTKATSKLVPRRTGATAKPAVKGQKAGDAKAKTTKPTKGKRRLNAKRD